MKEKDKSRIKIYDDIFNEIHDIKIFDTHEHLMLESERREKKIDFFLFFTHYTSTDLVSSGLSKENLEILKNPDIDLERKWNIFFPYWDKIKNTTYSKAIKIILKDVYSLEYVSLDNIKIVTDKMEEFKNEEFYDYIIKKMSKIEYVINDIDEEGENHGINLTKPDRDDFLSAMRLDTFLEINSIDKIRALEKSNDANIYTLNDLVKIIDCIFEERKDNICAFKIGAAYSRKMHFEEFTYFEAENNFRRILSLNEYNDYCDTLSMNEIKIVQDYLYHHCIKKCIDFDIPVQIHTGLLEGNNCDIRNSNPLMLIDLIKKYKKARFDLFHIGYPYTDELITIVKMFPNCYMNMCWIAEVSEVLYKNTLKLLIDMLPSNKIIAYGGDYAFVEGTYASQKMARENISDILFEKVAEGCFTADESIEFAKKILYKNAMALFME